MSLSASVSAQGTGETDLIAKVTVRIQFLFFSVSKTVRFKIGTITLPRIVYLAGEGDYGDAASVGSATFDGGELWLNMGQRANAVEGRFVGRGVGENSVRFIDPDDEALGTEPDDDEIFIIEHVAGTAGDETVKVRGMGREKIYSGVTKIVAYADDGDDTIIIREGVLSTSSCTAATATTRSCTTARPAP